MTEWVAGLAALKQNLVVVTHVFGIYANELCRIQTWALEEARRRLEAEGLLPDPDSKE